MSDPYTDGLKLLGLPVDESVATAGGALSPELAHEFFVTLALNQATLAIDEYYNGDRAWAERWLIRAYEANQKDEAK